MQVVSNEKVCEIIDDCGLNACRTGNCVDKVNGYTCDCDEDRELMLQVNGSACVARSMKISFSNEFRLKVVFVAACSIWSHAHTCFQLNAMQHQSSSQRVGALLIHRRACLDQHNGGSRLTPTVPLCPKGMATPKQFVIAMACSTMRPEINSNDFGGFWN